MLEIAVSKSGTLGSLFAAYMASSKWRDLGPSTKVARGHVIQRLISTPHPRKLGLTWGDCPLEQLGPSQIKEIRDSNLIWRSIIDPDTGEDTGDVVKSNLEGSNTWLKALRAAYSWGFNEPGLALPSNPTLGINLYPSSVEGFHCWSLDEIKSYRDRHSIGTLPRLALELLLYTGQRRSDVVRIGYDVMDTDSKGRSRFMFIQRKNMNTKRPTRAVIPYFPELRAIVEITPGTGHGTFLSQANGRPYTSESFGNMFREWCNDADLPQCSAHGLRKAFVVEMIRLRKRPAEVMAVTGHTTQKEFDRYARQYLRENASEQLMDDWLAV